jgi:hypothetical protein
MLSGFIFLFLTMDGTPGPGAADDDYGRHETWIDDDQQSHHEKEYEDREPKEEWNDAVMNPTMGNEAGPSHRAGSIEKETLKNPTA